MNSENSADVCVDVHEVAKMLGLAEITLAKMRGRGDGPPFLRFGRTIRYRRRDVEAWMTARTVKR